MDVLRYRAFPLGALGGNPAGVVLDATGMDAAGMQAVAAELGYSETAFLRPVSAREYTVAYFSPAAEVDFCGHATVAAAVAVAEHAGVSGDLLLHSNVGAIPVAVRPAADGWRATLTTVAPDTGRLDGLAHLLGLLRWAPDDVDASLPCGLAYAGLWHPIVWARSRQRLAELDYDVEGLAALSREKGWGTVSVLYRESPTRIHSRNAFPLGGLVEDPATGAAAGALGGFLRAHDLLPVGGRFHVLQGEDMGQPCLLEVDASGTAGIRVSGSAVRIS